MKLIVEQNKKYRMVLIVVAVAAILTYFVMQAIDPLLAQYGLLNTWSSIQSPPSGLASILGVTGGGWSMKYDVVIETNDRQVFSASVCGKDQKCDPAMWNLVPKASIPTPSFFTDSRAADCKGLGEFPLNPSGQIIECVYAVDASIDLVPQIYVALMADGSLKYFVLDFYSYFRVEVKTIFTSLLLYFVMFLIVYRSTRFIDKSIQAKK